MQCGRHRLGAITFNPHWAPWQKTLSRGGHSGTHKAGLAASSSYGRADPGQMSKLPRTAAGTLLLAKLPCRSKDPFSGLPDTALHCVIAPPHRRLCSALPLRNLPLPPSPGGPALDSQSGFGVSPGSRFSVLTEQGLYDRSPCGARSEVCLDNVLPLQGAERDLRWPSEARQGL